MRWTNLEPIIQHEVSQREKDKSRILMHIYTESRRMVLINLCAGQQWRNRHGEETYGLGGEGRKERVGYMERVTWKLASLYVKYIANRNLLYDSGNSNRGSVTT